MHIDGVLESIRGLQEEGALVEIYAFNTTWWHWDLLTHRLLELGYELTLTKSGSQIPLLITYDLFLDSFDQGYLLTIRFGQQIWTSALPEESHIDLQGGPGEIRTASDILEVKKLMDTVHEITGTVVVLIPETIHPEDAAPYISIGCSTN